MDLRHIENLVVDWAILHVLDTTLDAPLLANKVLDIQLEEVSEFIVKHVLKSLQDDNAYKAKFLPGTIMARHAEQLINDQDQAVPVSAALAQRLFDQCKQYHEPSCDVLVIGFHTGNIQAYGMLRLDFQKSYTHAIAFEQESFQIELVAQEIALPSHQQKVTQCYFGILPEESSEYDVIVINKRRATDEEERGRFLKTYLNAERTFDYKDKTKTFKKSIEDWAQKHLKEDFDTAQDLRRSLDNQLRNHALVSPETLVKEALAHDTDARHALQVKLEKEGLDLQERFEVDKRFVEKKMKTKTVRTDTGFVIRGDYELFEDSGHIEVQRNGDGTVNYIIKHVRHVKES